MTLTIDNLDGNGAQDYTSAISADAHLQIARALNQPSACTGALLVGSVVNPGASSTLPVPARHARIVVRSEAGLVLFTGYLTTEPDPVYLGVGLAGPVYRVDFAATGEEWLLDKQSPAVIGAAFATSAGSVLADFANRTGADLLTASDVMAGPLVGVFEPAPAVRWSINAARLANSTCSAYRILDDALNLSPVGLITHALNFDSVSADATLEIATLKTTQLKQIANDITVSGEVEPTAYITELFSGDGATDSFILAQEPFRAATPTGLIDSFNEGAVRTQTWAVIDIGGNLSLGSDGLALSGGTGVEGQTSLTALDAVELGGSLILEAAAVQLIAPSDGVLCGLYTGAVARSGCFAGYNVHQSGGSTLLTPLVNGVEVGTPFILLEGHTYTLRIRTHSVETQRVLQSYYTRISGEIVTFGGGSVPSPMALLFELRDLGNPSTTPATVLYDGVVSGSPSTAFFALVDSTRLTGSIGSCSVTQTGSAWVTSTTPGGTTRTRLVGAAGDGVDCKLSETGKLTFLANHIPIEGEIVTVSYRTHGRSVARLQDSVSVASEAIGGLPGIARWLGKVKQPVSRSSTDCEAAAQAILSISTSRTAAISGSYTALNPASDAQPDIWPGDALVLTANRQTMNVVARQVDLEDGHSIPELLTYRIAFANDWAESLGITLSESIAPDAALPQTALSTPGAVLANLQQLSIVSATETLLQIDAGIDPPTGGGFEVRLRDHEFGSGIGQNLVFRAPVRSFAIPRSAQAERYYIRMFDASTPPLYSRLSSAIFTNLPVS